MQVNLNLCCKFFFFSKLEFKNARNEECMSAKHVDTLFKVQSFVINQFYIQLKCDCDKSIVNKESNRNVLNLIRYYSKWF